METRIMEPQYLPETLEGQRIVLKRYALAQAEEYFALVNKNRLFLRDFMPSADEHPEISKTKDFISGMIEKWENKTTFFYAIREKEGNHLIGGIGANNITWRHDEVELAYWLAEEATGKGYISEALKTMEKLLFETGFHRIVIRSRVINEKSSAVADRAGYNLDGIARQDRLEHGKYRDTKIYSKLKNEWKPE